MENRNKTMTLRQRLIITVTIVSLVSAATFSVSLLFLTRSALSSWENRAVERTIEIGVASARNPAEWDQATQGFRAYNQLKAIKGLIEQRVVIAGILFGLVVFALSLGISSTVLMRVTRPLKELTDAINQAGRGNLIVKVNVKPRSEIGAVATAFNTMTERLRQLQENLRRTERLAAWRDVARILGHELRNPLTPIRLSVERLQLKYEEQSPDLPKVIKSSTRTILQEIEALDRIVREFSEFARLPAAQPKTIKLNRLIADIVAQYAVSSPDIQFETELDPGTEEWKLDPGLMRRVFINIIKNSTEVLNETKSQKGKITITTHLTKQGCNIAFHDNGPGIPQEIRTKVFDPQKGASDRFQGSRTPQPDLGPKCTPGR